MAEIRERTARPKVDDPTRELDQWLHTLDGLVKQVEGWVQPDWSTRIIAKSMEDATLGAYQAPALLIQREFTRVLLEPITRFAPGTEGVVDLYLMPAYDDIASLYRVDGDWKLHYAFPGDPVVAGIRHAEALPLTEGNLLRVLDAIASHAAPTL